MCVVRSDGVMVLRSHYEGSCQRRRMMWTRGVVNEIETNL
jgi:hypothetical protein